MTPCGVTGTCFDDVLNNPICVCNHGYEAGAAFKNVCAWKDCKLVSVVLFMCSSYLIVISLSCANLVLIDKS